MAAARNARKKRPPRETTTTMTTLLLGLGGGGASGATGVGGGRIGVGGSLGGGGGGCLDGGVGGGTAAGDGGGGLRRGGGGGGVTIGEGGGGLRRGGGGGGVTIGEGGGGLRSGGGGGGVTIGGGGGGLRLGGRGGGVTVGGRAQDGLKGRHGTGRKAIDKFERLVVVWNEGARDEEGGGFEWVFVLVQGKGKQKEELDTALEKKVEPELSYGILTNPARVVPAQEKHVRFLEGTRYVPIKLAPSGFVLLKDLQPSKVEVSGSSAMAVDDEPQLPQAFEYGG
ncbi:glycine-rich cell wall structural protein 1.8-like [Zingiber officinale]|uniref:glycine-rich cell wall structural protein 1.8-like n=1 Tax=Zingiber officinale TaxID=94328 RepID=UPI001C4C5EB9|nr:glycine-rich cell wall structural protein 1.8-like [Zingiber officinale]